MEKIRCEDSRLCYFDEGQGEPLVLLHGFCGSSEYWERVIPLLSDSYRLIVPDLRGHGASPAPMGAYTIEQMADDVAVLLDALELPRVTLLGHSLGGYITLSFAQRHPSRLKAFGLIHSTGYPDGEEAKEKRLAAVSAIQSEGITAFVDGLVPGLFAPRTAETAPELLDKAKEIGYRTPPQGAVGAALAMRERPDRRDVISSAGVPVLLVSGEEDGLVPAERTFTSDKPHVVQAVIPEAGHMSMLEQPERLAAAVTGFMERIG